MARVTQGDVPAVPNSALALSVLRVEAGDRLHVADGENDSLLYVAEGMGKLEPSEGHPLGSGAAALVLAGEEAALEADETGLTVVRATVGPEADRHALLGPREEVVRLADAGTSQASSARSFHVLFGPHNGSARATLFVGLSPPGKAPWHYHLYDEIVWVPEGPGRLHLEAGADELGAGSAFRLRPREVHIVENASADREMAILGVFTPAGSPSAAYLIPDVAATYRFGE